MFILKVNTDGAAFDEDASHEIARILREVADMIDRGSASGLIDVNGNDVGYFCETDESLTLSPAEEAMPYEEYWEQREAAVAAQVLDSGRQARRDNV